ncbi:SMP-30/gluconolactonase/LRE family protein [Massilia arenae]|nr:SMP-30/gluconolactonase/LRE family protein [Massilia arenae]
MATEKFEVVHDAPMLVGESAIWHEVESALYWVDIEGYTVNRLHAASGKFTSWKMGSNPSALAIDDNNFLVVATRHGLLRLNTTDGSEKPITDAPYDPSKVRFNDGRVDPAGRFWIGTMYEPRDQPAAEMYVLDKDQLRQAWSGGMTNSNGLAWSLDGRTMYHADTTTHRIDCYDFDPATGEQSNRRTIVTFPSDKSAADYGGRPDGATMDSEGMYWVAMFEGARILRIAPNGEIVREIKLPVKCPTSVAFGGPDLRTLYITSASHGRSKEELEQYPLSGKVLCLKMDVAGREEPEYRI